MSLGEGTLAVMRLLRPEEAGALQGVRQEFMLEGLSRSVVFRGLGNAMTVPVVGQLLYVVLRRAMGAHGSGASSDEESSDGNASSGSSSMS